MKTWKLLHIGMAGLATALSACAATTNLFKFDDMDPVMYEIIPDGYGGLNWDNFFIQNGAEAAGFANGVVSTPNVAFNGLGKPASFSNASPFTLDSAYFTSVYVDADQLQVQGFAGGIEIYSNSYSIYHDLVTQVNFDYAGVDTVEFSTTDGAIFTMDNMVTSIPEPGTAGLWLVGAALAGFGLWRRESGICVRPSQKPIAKGRTEDGI